MKLTAEWTRQRRKISELEDNKKVPKANKKKQTKGKKERRKEERLRGPWDYQKRPNIHVIGALEGEEKKVRTEKVLKEIMATIIQTRNQ